ncbi:hypothetical protein GCM10027422_39710 [Hymenobacter arcticus]
MKNLFLLSALTLLAGACQKKDAAPAEDPTWLKLEIPTTWTAGDQAFSIAGDIDHTLLVSTTEKLYLTSDHGKTWQESQHNFHGAVWGLLPRHDTIFALTNYFTNSKGERLNATEADMYSVDFGKTWAYTLFPYKKSHALTQPIGQVGAAGIAYRVQPNTQPIPGSSAQLVIASDLLRTDAAGRQQALRLPARHYLNNLHLDAQNRLYVAASGLSFDETTGQALEATQQRTALVYISRQPLP